MLKKTEKIDKKEQKAKTKKSEKVVEQPEPVKEVKKPTKKVVYTASVLDVVKQEFEKLNPNFDKNGVGAGFFKSDIYSVSEDDQNNYFNMLKNIFTDLNVQKPKISLREYSSTYLQLLEMVTEMAVCGCVPAMDYLCFIYKKGVDDVIPTNLVRAHEWGLLAIAGGSKLSPERLRLFFDPVYLYVSKNNLVPKIMKKYNAESDDDLINFIAYSFANVFNEKQGITLEAMSKKRMISNESFQVFLKNVAKTREESLQIMEKYIA